MADRSHLVEVLEEDAEHGAWRPVVGNVTTRLRDYFVKSHVVPSDEAASRIVAEAYRVLSQCTPPTDPQSRRTGLVCGYVQSGKTASMTAVSALAKDNRFRIIVLIAGTTTNLVKQNRERLETQLRAAAPDWTWLMLTNPRLARDRPDLEALMQEWNSPYYDEMDRRTLFISVMKNHSHLRHLTQLLASVDLSHVPAIIFDDEADQASLNTRPNAPDASTTYVTISALRQALSRHTYLQYTATPQAPLLITRIDSLSADFAELVSAGEGYVGGQDFFGNTQRLIEVIPPSEIFRDGELPHGPPASLLRALQVFFVGVAAGRRLEESGHRSMLIHPSKATATHRHYFDWTTTVKSHWHRMLLDGAPEDVRELLEEFHEAYDDLLQTCPKLPTFKAVTSKLPVAINQTTITLVNSVDGREVPWHNAASHILVGGEKLGRGYTVRGLTVTYMPRPPGGWTADTIQQRARFFGYHAEYLGYCRVFLHPDVRTTYVAYVNHEEDMRARLSEHRGRPLKDWRRLFYLDSRLAPTRRNVLSSPYLRPRLSEGWFAPRAPHLSPEDGSQNRRLVRHLEQQLELQPHDSYPRHRSALVRLQDVFEQVLVPLSYLDVEDALGLCVANCNLKTILEEDPDASCRVYLMDHGHLRVRRLSNGVIPQLFQGRSSAGADSYPGDRAFAEEAIPTIQVHLLSVVDGDRVLGDVPAVAVRLPRQTDMIIHDE